jgi:pilus assembly protein Flp/PilA
MVLRETGKQKPCIAEKQNMKNVMKKFLNNKSGATAIEYGLIAALIAVAVIGGVSGSSAKAANDTFTNVSTEIAKCKSVTPACHLRMDLIGSRGPWSAAFSFFEYLMTVNNSFSELLVNSDRSA